MFLYFHFKSIHWEKKHDPGWLKSIFGGLDPTRWRWRIANGTYDRNGTGALGNGQVSKDMVENGVGEDVDTLDLPPNQ